MNEDETKRMNPAGTAQLQENIAAVTAEHQEHLLGKPTAPPSYNQAIGHEPVAASQPGGVPPPHVVVVTQPTTTYGPEPMDIQCPYCHNYCRTRLRSKPTSQTHLFALILCLLQLYCCICLPYCIRSCMNTNHYCGMCDQYLGTYQR